MPLLDILSFYGVYMGFVLLPTILSYFVAAGLQLVGLKRNIHFSRGWFYATSAIAIVLHGYYLHHWIDVAGGQNLYIFNMISLLVWLISVLIVFISLQKPVETLALLIYPLAAISIVLVKLFPGSYIINTAVNIKQLLHIIFSIFAFSVLCLAGLQAILLNVQDSLLSNKRAMGLLQILPPIETMENLLFQLIKVGFILLTVVLFSAFLLFHNILSGELAQKTILSSLAWGVFAILLWGRHYWSWHGRTGIRWTLWGVSLLIVSYFGSKLIG